MGIWNWWIECLPKPHRHSNVCRAGRTQDGKKPSVFIAQRTPIEMRDVRKQKAIRGRGSIARILFPPNTGTMHLDFNSHSLTESIDGAKLILAGNSNSYYQSIIMYLHRRWIHPHHASQHRFCRCRGFQRGRKCEPTQQKLAAAAVPPVSHPTTTLIFWQEELIY